jgi:UDP-N-acetylmuramoylalanine--D-glutamate ligase
MSSGGPVGDRGLSGKRLTVMGLGLFGGGAGAARWALSQGARVTVTDQKPREALREVVRDLEEFPARHPVRFALGGHRSEDFEETDVLIVNPAVPPTSPWVQRAKDAGVHVTTATALLLGLTRARVVAITGTQGKSSTASFTHQLIEAAMAGAGRCLLGGNIGGSLLEQADGLTERDVVVLELSSYQLEHLPPDTPRTVSVAAITNIGVDHIERHGTVDRYREAKLRLMTLIHRGGTAIVPQGELAELARTRTPERVLTHGSGGDFRLTGTWAHAMADRDAQGVADTSTLRVPGEFQRANLLVALAAALRLGFEPDDLRPTVPLLTGLRHRMESLGEFMAGGVTVEVIDNGVSTTPESTLSAVKSVQPAGRALLIAGGQAKQGVSLRPLADELAARGDWIMVPFGAAAADLARAAREAGATVDDQPQCESVEDAARRALAIAERDGVRTVLFSPACASFDRYANFQERALAFRRVLPNEGRRHP